MPQITVKADITSMDAVNDFISAQMEDAGLPMKLAMSVLLAVEEVFVNIAHYAYAPGEGDATIECDIDGGTLRLAFIDAGKPYDPLSHEDPDITAGAADREIGGLGLLLVKKIMDTAEYHREGERNVFRLSKTV